jgi:Fe-S oxidoreductase
LQAIPGVELVEMIRMKENAFCCGAGRGTREAFPDFASWAAKERLQEVKAIGAKAIVSTCPWCKENFAQAVSKEGEKVKVLDISEIILAAI